MITLNTLLVSVLPLFAPNSNSGSDWPQYNGPRHGRTVAGTLGKRLWTEAPPTPEWTIETAAGFSSFTLAADLAFTLVGKDGEEIVIALDARTGEEKWSFATEAVKYDRGGGAGTEKNKGGDGPRTSVSYEDGRVFAMTSTLHLYCLDAKTGQRHWDVDLIEDHEGRNIMWQNAASPLLEGGLVIVAGGGPGESLLAFHQESGELCWKTADERITHATPIIATIHGVRQVIFYLRSGLVALRPSDGEELWRIEYPYRTSTAASPVVFEDVVYCSAGYGVGAGAFRLSVEDGQWSNESLWRKRNDHMNHWSTPVCKEGFLYGMFSFKDYGDGPMKCVDIRTGEEKWSRDGFGPGNCILVGDDLVALTDAGEVVLVESTPEAYSEISRAPFLEGKCWSTPTFADGDLFIRSTTQGMRLDLSAAK
ncbi:MAG: PQQ-like beta-propeller repeat protein [Planctomycetota bacterium]|jgi:outer membrane protein assembly factor BamB|nr:PQQ-like beta-propeller repeat protein [Planctomycetota bacterium]MDP6939594.1 PQQ-like beta-propeller repeat protein [Planctomycetota bacterium]